MRPTPPFGRIHWWFQSRTFGSGVCLHGKMTSYGWETSISLTSRHHPYLLLLTNWFVPGRPAAPAPVSGWGVQLCTLFGKPLSHPGLRYVPALSFSLIKLPTVSGVATLKQWLPIVLPSLVPERPLAVVKLHCCRICVVAPHACSLTMAPACCGQPASRQRVSGASEPASTKEIARLGL